MLKPNDIKITITKGDNMTIQPKTLNPVSVINSPINELLAKSHAMVAVIINLKTFMQTLAINFLLAALSSTKQKTLLLNIFFYVHNLIIYILVQYHYSNNNNAKVV